MQILNYAYDLWPTPYMWECQTLVCKFFAIYLALFKAVGGQVEGSFCLDMENNLPGQTNRKYEAYEQTISSDEEFPISMFSTVWCNADNTSVLACLQV